MLIEISLTEIQKKKQQKTDKNGRVISHVLLQEQQNHK